MSQRLIILDTETTGLYPEKSATSLVEFAGLEMINRQMTDSNLSFICPPGRDMLEEAAKVHGLTIERLKRRMRRRLPKVNRFVRLYRGAELIIHNAKFDVGFLNMEFRRMGCLLLRNWVVKLPTRWPRRVKCFRGKRQLGCLV